MLSGRKVAITGKATRSTTITNHWQEHEYGGLGEIAHLVFRHALNNKQIKAGRGRDLGHFDPHHDEDAESDYIDTSLPDHRFHLLNIGPELGAIGLECTNMVPYAGDLREHLGLPVFSIYSFIA